MKFHPPNKVFSQAYRKFLFRPMGRLVLLLTTTGRKSGRQHTVGVQYELIDGKFCVGAADGVNADWYRNILKNPNVQIQVGSQIIPAIAETITDAEIITDYLEYRLKKHPMMIRLILRLDGIGGRIDRSALKTYSSKIGLVILTPGGSA